jgi:hypothetical protein
MKDEHFATTTQLAAGSKESIEGLRTGLAQSELDTWVFRIVELVDLGSHLEKLRRLASLGNYVAAGDISFHPKMMDCREQIADLIGLISEMGNLVLLTMRLGPL